MLAPLCDLVGLAGVEKSHELSCCISLHEEFQLPNLAASSVFPLAHQLFRRQQSKTHYMSSFVCASLCQYPPVPWGGRRVPSLNSQSSNSVSDHLIVVHICYYSRYGYEAIRWGRLE